MKNVIYKFCGLLIWFNTFITYGQTFNIEGNISTGSTAVKYASITFIDKNDTLKKYTAITDIAGNYRLNIITDVEKGESTLPQTIVLGQNYPNPFSTSTAIPYKLNKPQYVSIKIFDILGREIRTFSKGFQGTGTYGITWDGKDNFGRKVTAGVYFYQLKTQDGIQVKKMIFGIGNNAVPLISGRISPNTIGLRKEDNAQLAGGTFTVKIQNISNTEPRFLPDEFDDVIIQKDTTLNFTVQTGKIVFVKYDTVAHKSFVYKMNIDGSEITQLSFPNELLDTTDWKNIRIRGSADSPRWSWDGKKIVYSESQGPDESHIVIMNEDGSYKKTLTNVGGYDIRPKWSPKGDQILYLRGTYLGTIIATSIVDTNGVYYGGSRFDIHIAPESRVFEGDSVWYNLNDVQWHSDGEQLYVWGNVGGVPNNYNLNGEIFLLDVLTGKIIQRLTHNIINEWGFEINNIGSSIIFFRGPYQTDRKIFLMNLTDIQTTAVTTGKNDGWPRWGNNGELIVYVKDENDDQYNDPFFSNRIYIVRIKKPLKEIRISPVVANEPDIFTEQ